MPDLTAVRGKVRKSSPCWILESETGESLYLVGDLSKVHDGQDVMATGQLLEKGFCGSGLSLIVNWIDAKIGGAEAIPTTVVRDITVKATFSSIDLKPRFRLEGKPLGLTADGAHWVGFFPGVSVKGKLDVYFESGAWDFQKFTVYVEALNPDTGETYKSSFPPVQEKKGYVMLQKTLDVGAGV